MSRSPGQLAFRRFVRNRAALAGTVVIALGIFLALFAYFIIPDPGSNANTQIVELKLKKPGFEIRLLKIPAGSEESVPLMKRLRSGIPVRGRYIPILDYEIANGQLRYTHYTGNDSSGIAESIPLATLLSPGARGTVHPGGGLTLRLKDGREKVLSSEEVKKAVEARIRTKRFLLGTDALGRDYFSRLILGARVSLTVGFMAVLISLLIGLVLGSVAGYYRSWPDEVIMYFINIFWSIPTLLLALSLSLVFSRGLSQVYMAIGLTMWVEVARMVRGQFIGLRETEYIEAARSLGFRSFRTIFRHMLPNVTGPVIVVVASNFAAAILLEAGLSFLGLGVDRPTPSWGAMLSDNRNFLIAGLPHLAILPGLAISLFVLSFFLIGNGLRDAFDVRDNRK